MANFKRLSRYTGGTVTKNRSLQDFLILRKPLNLKEGEGDIFVEITQDLEQRPDLIAQKAYEDPNLWWVVFEFNEIRDPLFDLVAGQLIRLPALDRVLEAVEELEG
jgi:hypothetical protein